MAFTPYPFEDVGAMIRDSNPDLYLFSSDYPHIEGGRNPLGRFSASLDGFSDEVLEQFYSGNMMRLIGTAAGPAASATGPDRHHRTTGLSPSRCPTRAHPTSAPP